MDDPILSADESASPKARKPAPRRPRAPKAAEPVVLETPAASDAAEAPSASEASPRGRRPRTKKSRSTESDAVSGGSETELFPAASEAAPAVYSFSPDDGPSEVHSEQSPVSPSIEPVNDYREDTRPIFVPDAGAVAGDPAHASDEQHTEAEGGAEVSSPGAVDNGGPGAARREERKSWWERKKEKKRQKWLERQAGGGAGQGGAHGGGQASHGGGHGGGRERNPVQPPPPSLQGPVGALPVADERLADLAALEALAAELSADASPVDLTEVHSASAGDLAQRLRALGETVAGMPPRRALVEQVFAWASREKHALRESGVLDLTDAGHGFVTHRFNSYRLHPESTYVPAALIRRHGLRRGQEIEVLARPPQNGERCPAAAHVLSVMGTTPELAREVTAFEELTPYYPTRRILVEAPDIHKDISMRAVDLLTPIGFGQRGLIVAPPRTGKTVLLQNIANSITNNYPEATLILLLIDERPEEVTDFKRHTRGEVVSSTFDETPESHAHAAEMVIERARRLVEMGKDVIILLDSITRLARAYNALAGNGGKTMSGGIESNALQRPKRFFGSARNIEGGGSLTILGTALVDTNSRMDEVIFEEFKGTGNMELHLDRGLSDKRIFPAINIDRSGTRKEELIYHPDEMLRVYGLRRAMQGIPPVEAMDMFIQRLKKTRTNTEFLLSLNR
ncbi:MAG: hypothetical protein RLZZ50_1968 [Verrucomicrobiota bacterium]